MRAEDRIGTKFGRLLIINIIRGKDTIAVCQCDCGKTHEATLGNITNGTTTSCGCAKIERIRKIGFEKRTHGCSHDHCTREYRSWQGMKSRCNNPKDPFYSHYGGRGIKVCERWINSFETFCEDMGERPVGKTLDRIDNNGDYCQENCRWSTQKEQGRNTRVNKLFDYKGERRTIPEISEMCGIKAVTLRQRIEKHHWSMEQATSTPVKTRYLRKYMRDPTQTTLL